MKFELTDLEAKILKEFLKDLSDRFCNDGCNEYELENTKENVKFLEEVIKTQFDKEKDIKEEIKFLHDDAKNRSRLCTANFFILDYLKNKMFKTKK